jgi:putative flippase GtrA
MAVTCPEHPEASESSGASGEPGEPEPRTLVQRLVRCMGVSMVSTTISVVVLVTGTLVLGLAAWIANVVAVAASTGPSYSLNRRWTWGKRDTSDPWREVMPFWMMSFLGLLISTLLVGVTGAWAEHMHLPQPLGTFSLLGAHLSGFALLWGVQFVVLDRVLFRRTVPAVAVSSVSSVSSVAD